jgi:hypothetical protein
LLFDEQRLGNDGTEASWPCKPDDGDNQMKEKDEDIAHPSKVSKPEKTPNLVIRTPNHLLPQQVVRRKSSEAILLK